MKKPRARRRKCYICGRFGKPNEMVHGGYGRVMYSEARFAHKECKRKEKTV